MGIFIALIIITLWTLHLVFILSRSTVDFVSAWFYLHVLVQTYLYTGLFITAHDAMHKTVSRNPRVNSIIGTLAAFLYAGLSYKRLSVNHFKHHKNPGTAGDPDYCVSSRNFWVWWGTFMLRYATVPQFIVMAVAYNVLKIRISEISLWMFWITPAILSSLQLFYFGTYLPHRQPHTSEMEPHKARTQKKNHFFAMISCYFFGYHYEHHDSPHTPWWKLYKTKINLLK